MAVGDINKIIVIDSPALTAAEVERYCEQYQPGCIIIDQLWKVKGFGGDNSDVKVQTAIANWARELCKKYAPVIGVYQADGSAEGVNYFGMDKIYMSKTAVQGECDLIICMGRSYEQGKEDTEEQNGRWRQTLPAYNEAI
jgi:RecA-family ATPase